jgi:hypothetical protein
VTQTTSQLTLATLSHLPQAVALLESARRHTPHKAFYLFAVDATAASIESVRRVLTRDHSWIRLFGPDDLGPRRGGFLSAFAYYNAMELSCFAKYVAIEHVLNDPSSGDLCVFADADMLFFDDIRGVLPDLRDRAILLTPHLLGPSSDEVEYDIMTHGWMNAGFLVVSQTHAETPPLLDWLIDRISKRGYLAPQFGMSYDQKWVSGLPVLFHGATAVTSHPGVNVGYWNVRERPIAKAGGRYSAESGPLLLFHFSGFDAAVPDRLSKYADIACPPGSALRDVCDTYRTVLNGSAGLRASLHGFETRPCSTSPLFVRVQAGTRHHPSGVVMPALWPGLFARAGAMLDGALRRTLGRRN